MNKNFIVFLLLLSAFTSEAQQAISEREFLLGKFEYRNSPDFVRVDKKHASKTIFLNKVVYEAFKDMNRQAKLEGIEVKIISGTRNFIEQKIIWEKKWAAFDSLPPREKAEAILEYSAMPATSRHHWGTELDLNHFENSYFEEGKGKAEYEWLIKNAPNFGFYQVYTAGDNGRTGYKEEKWHWSYLPLATKYLQRYNELVDYCEISGFEGSELAEDAGMISRYVNGIPQELQVPPVLLIQSTGKLVLHEALDEE